MNTANLAKGLSVPALTVGADLLRNSNIGDTMGGVAGATNEILEAGSSLTSSIFTPVTGGLTGGLLTNDVLKQFKFMEEHKKLRWALSAATTAGIYTGGSALAAYATAAAGAYFVGKHGWKYGVKAAKTLGKTALTPVAGVYGGVKGAISGAGKGVKDQVKKLWTKSA